MSRRSAGARQEVGSALRGVLDSGAPLKLGRRHRPDYLLIVLIAILALIGLVTLFSIAPAITGGSDTSKFMWRQGLFLIAGVVMFAITSRIPLDFWRRWGAKIFILALVLCFVLPIMGWLEIPPAHCPNGACRWFSFDPIGTFQPAEFLKFGLVLFVSGFLATRLMAGEIDDWRKTFVPLGIVVLAALFVIVVMQKDLGTGAALVAIMLAQLAVSGAKLRNLLKVVALVAAAGAVSILIAPHRLARVATFLGQGNAAADYHTDQAMIALGSGGFFGRGLGQSIQAFGWLPEAIHDSIFAILGEMFGFVGLLAVLLVFAVLLKRIIDKVDFTESPYLRLVLAGVFGWLSAHVILNIGAMTHVLPLTGITLPLVSFGGTSMLFIMASLGLVFAISRYTIHRKVKSQEGEINADFVRRRRIGRPYYANRGSR